jgi:hypothetical protein
VPGSELKVHTLWADRGGDWSHPVWPDPVRTRGAGEAIEGSKQAAPYLPRLTVGERGRAATRLSSFRVYAPTRLVRMLRWADKSSIESAMR